MANVAPTVTMNIERRWFADILAIPRRKDIEYRKMSPFWQRRLEFVGDGPFKLRLLNGMRPPVPEALIVVNQLERDETRREFRLHLGRLLSVKYWDRRREIPKRDHMRDFVVYHKSGETGTDLRPFFAVTGKAMAEKIVGDRIWLIAGSDSRKKAYTLASCFIVGEVSKTENPKFSYHLSGTEGKVFDPPIPLNDLAWFPAFLRSQRNFRSGLQLLNDAEVVVQLEELASQHEATSSPS